MKKTLSAISLAMLSACIDNPEQHREMVTSHFQDAVWTMGTWRQAPYYLEDVRRIGFNQYGFEDATGATSIRYADVFLKTSEIQGEAPLVCAKVEISEDTFGNSYYSAARVHHWSDRTLEVCVDYPYYTDGKVAANGNPFNF